jgi:hypothetical protein
MSERERPQYGEYASVDEQIAAGGIPVEPAPLAPPAGPPVGREALAPPLASTRVAGEPPVRRSWDVVLTITLLVIGAISVLTSIPGYLGFSEVLVDSYRVAGYGDYTSIALADGIGIGILVCQSVIYVVTVAVALSRLRGRRVAFFVPITGAVLAAVVFVVLVLVAMTSDPGLAAWVSNQG